MPANTTRDRGELLSRLTTAAHELADANDAAKAARELRDQLVVEAVDQYGLQQRAVAAAAEISSARVIAILGASQVQPAPAPEVIPADVAAVA